jgi:uncharacterized protein YbjT (DUF2867 family)
MEARISSHHASAPILVTGGTGTLGHLVVARLRDAGRDVRVLSRGLHGHGDTDGVDYATADLTTGAGIDAVVAGVDVIVHCAGTAKGDEEKTRQLVEAAARAGARHLVYISVVGADRVPVSSRVDRAMFGYFAAKLAAERVVAESGLPWTTLRATQFHEAMLLTAQGLARLPVMPAMAGFRFQPVAAGEVAARLAELALGVPSGRVADLAGPQPYEMADLLRAYLRASGQHRLVLRVPTFGPAASAVRAGALLAPDRAVGHLTWEDFLAQRVGPSSEGASLSTLPQR